MPGKRWTDMSRAEITAEVGNLADACNTVAAEASPDTIIMGTDTWVELYIGGFDFGPWPVSIWRRQGARAVLRAYVRTEAKRRVANG